ncbi:hypothetical protein ASZ90_003619 [hydrocarbon metagenome]|uniref:DUF72 domain-containing protein n=1 Tax=hydrocarbon metagenome TaxID=938273 RepID=A0A0W8G099_9ZZZZ
MSKLRIGTCSWKYDSWKGLVYPDVPNINYLKEYSEKYNTVEIDQWFWSLYGERKISLPKFHDVESYSQSVPNDFMFTIKIPNCITLTHYYKKSKNEPLKKNPFFLSEELTTEFLKTLEPMKSNLGPLMFQFEYLNRDKMPSQQDFQIQFGNYAEKLDENYLWGVEIRNPNYINKPYFEFLNEFKLIPVFLQGYFMPSIFEIIEKHIELLPSTIVIRLHGSDRKGIEEKSSGNWDEIIEPKDEEIYKLTGLIQKLQSKEIDIYINVNNHYEGSAPLTIERINKTLNQKRGE